MPLRSSHMVPSTASRVFIRANRDGDGRIMGQLYNPYLGSLTDFCDVVDLANKLDRLFDSLSFPQAASDYRRFADKEQAAQRPLAAMADETEAAAPGFGEAEVFVVHVKFRQNTSWQGTVRAPGQAEERRFRSTLELLKLLDDELDG